MGLSSIYQLSHLAIVMVMEWIYRL
uniref:Uncharacterized protein LOC107410089 n=1 Tax=Rhizophora mucronata TaxID=61149 RepID=A0A2P2N0G4_RHIMU